MLDSGIDGPSAPDGDVLRMPNDAPVILDDTPVMPHVGPVIPVGDAPMSPGADVPMIPVDGTPEIPGDTTPRNG